MTTPGLGDVFKALEVCKWIYDNCFDKLGTADVKYGILKNDIQGIYETLDRLRTAAAVSPLLTTGLYISTRSGEIQPGREVSAAFGELKEPLEALRIILKTKVSYEKDGRGIIRSVIWALKTQTEIESLVRRLQFHMQKILLVIEPRKLDIMYNVEEWIDEILHYLRPQPTFVLEPLPAWMDEKFLDALSINPPKSYKQIGQVPLSEGLDACIRLYKQSTVLYVSGEDVAPTIQQYLNLRKAHWMVSKIKEGGEYQATHPGSMNRRAIRQLEILLHGQYQRGIRFADEDLRIRDKSSFIIWPAPEGKCTPIFPEPGIQEDKVLDLSLPTEYPVQAHKIDVFRTDNIRYRIVETKLRTDSIGAMPIPKDIHLHHDRLIPWYANQSTSSCGIGFYNEIHRTNMEYQLKNEQDLFEFQRIFTGYRVLKDHVGIQWSFNEQMRFAGFPFWSRIHDGTGRVQVWKWDAPQQSHSDTRRSLMPSRRSQNSNFTTAAVSALIQGQDIDRITTIGHKDGVVLARRKAVPPVLLIYTRTGDGQDYTFLHIDLVGSLRAIPNACDCFRNPQVCTRIVLQNKQGGSEEPFIIRKLAVKDSQVDTWNLAVFSAHHPRHPRYLKGKGIERISATFLIVDFPSAKQRLAFNTQLTEAVNQRDSATINDTHGAQRMTSLSENPSTLRKASSPQSTRYSSLSSDETVVNHDAESVSSAPEIDALSFSPSFTPSMVFGRNRTDGLIYPQ